jgi:hypothetical protein
MKMIALGLFAFPFACVLLGVAHELFWNWIENRRVHSCVGPIPPICDICKQPMLTGLSARFGAAPMPTRCTECWSRVSRPETVLEMTRRMLAR